MQVHKEPISSIPNSTNGRGDTEVEIYGMEGIPEKDMEEKRQQIKRGKYHDSGLPFFLVSQIDRPLKALWHHFQPIFIFQLIKSTWKMKLNGTKTIPWKFFVPILQASDYFRWWCHKGELLIRKALAKHDILKFFKRLLSFLKSLLMDLQS